MPEINTFDELLGKTLTAVEGLEAESAEVRFLCADGFAYRLYHDQDCCEQVRIIDVCGVVTDLIGSPVVRAEVVSNAKDPGDYAESYDEEHAWTFYKLDTEKGDVVIRWLGESNGWYSICVEFERTK